MNKRRARLILLLALMVVCAGGMLFWLYKENLRSATSPLAGTWTIHAIDNKPLEGDRKPTVTISADSKITIDLTDHDLGPAATVDSLRHSLAETEASIRKQEQTTEKGVTVSMRPTRLTVVLPAAHSVTLTKP